MLARFVKLFEQLGHLFDRIDGGLSRNLVSQRLGVERASDLVEVRLNAGQPLFQGGARPTVGCRQRFIFRNDPQLGPGVCDDGGNAAVWARFSMTWRLLGFELGPQNYLWFR